MMFGSPFVPSFQGLVSGWPSVPDSPSFNDAKKYFAFVVSGKARAAPLYIETEIFFSMVPGKGSAFLLYIPTAKNFCDGCHKWPLPRPIECRGSNVALIDQPVSLSLLGSFRSCDAKWILFTRFGIDTDHFFSDRSAHQYGNVYAFHLRSRLNNLFFGGRHPNSYRFCSYVGQDRPSGITVGQAHRNYCLTFRRTLGIQ